MSAIEKIWGASQQYKELEQWLIDQGKEAYIKRYMNDLGNHDAGASIALFTEEIDHWLLENYPHKWLTDQIKNMYGYDVEFVEVE